MRLALIACALACIVSSAHAQEKLGVVPTRTFTLDGRIYARHVDADSIILASIPARSAITRVYVMPEDSAWMLSASIIIATEYGEILTWTSETAGVDDCLGCFASDWPQTFGDVLYSKNARTLVARLTGWTGDARGTFRIIVEYIELH